MKKIIIYSIVLSALIAVFGVYFLRFKVTDIDNLETRNSVQRIPYEEISSAGSIKQTFRAKKDNLAAIEVLFGNFARKKSEPASLGLYKNLLLSAFKKQPPLKAAFTLYDENSAVISCQEADLSKIKGLRHVPFSFPPIENAKDKRYVFEIKPLTQETFQVLTLIAGDSLNSGDELRINGKLVEKKKLLFVSYVKPRFISCDNLLDRISQNKPFYFKKKSLYVLIFIYLVGQFFLLFYLANKMRGAEKRKTKKAVKA
ncbi:MAG: hypothetical protein WCI43_01885 [Candidatus Firestonebacteria bacterium]